MTKIVFHGHGISTIDATYVRAGLASVHLIVEGGRAAFVDSGCNTSLPVLTSALAMVDVPPENVDYVVLTHVHLDHAGGAGAMMRTFPNARLVVHPRGARHMVDPTRLIAGAKDVYGAETMHRLYGDILPISEERIVEATHELTLALPGRSLICLDTPGHARHHIALLDERTGHIFTGDIFGLSYRELDLNGRAFVFPTTTPVQFDPVAMHQSIDLLMSHRPEAAYLTHFGQIRQLDVHAETLHRLVDAHVSIALRERASGLERHTRINASLTRLLLDEARAFGTSLTDDQVLSLYAADVELNTQGLEVWLGE